ncbi:AraC family transcriptional regulator [Phragmitibacter flavus]|uniref:AraC family transcriptional regulator n=1 Tax=Phragmitibacter flavus TaxID=2576071 RepID=A0A5R8KGQ4_9BACT|nr:AraC family transcriptional regulator [Phragmitibacter flavus]TLD71411.1 AraC family transcriptional regulator [Phragmitibacter flavus]
MQAPSPQQVSADFFQQLDSPSVLATMFDFLPGVYLFVKDHQHRYMKVNRSLARLHGCDSDAEMIGKCDFDFNPPALAAQYVEEDRKVMSERLPIIDKIWLVQDSDGMPHWHLSTKLPLIDKQNEVIGIAGVMRPYDRAGDAPGSYQRLTQVCDHVLAHYGETMSVDHLASLAHLSVSQLQREFSRLFSMSPIEYVTRVRLHMASRQLEQSTNPVGQIALDCGFYDQSHFTRVFRTRTGLSPLEYRQRFAAVR